MELHQSYYAGRQGCDSARPQRAAVAVRDGGGTEVGNWIIVVVDDVETVVLKDESTIVGVLAEVLHQRGWDRSGLRIY